MTGYNNRVGNHPKTLLISSSKDYLVVRPLILARLLPLPLTVSQPTPSFSTYFKQQANTLVLGSNRGKAVAKASANAGGSPCEDGLQPQRDSGFERCVTTEQAAAVTKPNISPRATYQLTLPLSLFVRLEGIGKALRRRDVTVDHKKHGVSEKNLFTGSKSDPPASVIALETTICASFSLLTMNSI